MKLSRIIKIALVVLCLGALTSCSTPPRGEPGEFRIKATVLAVNERIEVEVSIATTHSASIGCLPMPRPPIITRRAREYRAPI